MITPSKTSYTPEIQFWLMAGVVVFFFWWAMTAQSQVGKANKMIEAQKTEIAVLKGKYRIIKQTVVSQDTAISLLNTSARDCQ